MFRIFNNRLKHGSVNERTLDSKSRNEKKIAVNRWSKTRSPGLFAAILFYSADSDAMTTGFHPSGRRSPRSFTVIFHCSLLILISVSRRFETEKDILPKGAHCSLFPNAEYDGTNLELSLRKR